MARLKQKNKFVKKILNYTVIFEPAEEGGFVVHVPALPGCHTQGETLDEAYKMAQDAISAYIETLRDMQEEIPEEKEMPIIARVPVRA
jgi:predicted RNase H-like HicB family nuclease